MDRVQIGCCQSCEADLQALRSLQGEQAVQYTNSRLYLLRHICSCSRPVRVGTGSIRGAPSR
jgi:hypothetical protein